MTGVAASTRRPLAGPTGRLVAARRRELHDVLRSAPTSLVVLQALHCTGVRRIENFTATYGTEVARLRTLREGRESGGGDHYNNQPFRIGERLSRALIADALEGRIPLGEAKRLMSMNSASTFDEYARRLGAA